MPTCVEWRTVKPDVPGLRHRTQAGWIWLPRLDLLQDHDMPRRNQTYAFRLAFEGGGQVKAELVSVGQSGEKSLKRIETAGDRASDGLKGVGRQAEFLRTGMRTLGTAIAGVATIGGLAALTDR